MTEENWMRRRLLRLHTMPNSYPYNFELRPGSWKATLFCCPNGHIGSLIDHEIKPNGEVIPSVVCTKCDFHEIIKLEVMNKVHKELGNE